MKICSLPLCVILAIYLFISLWGSPFSESATIPLPQKILSPHLQRDDCVVRPNVADEFMPYIEEFLLTDTRAGISLYSCVNWAEGFLKSEGIGKHGSRRAAELVARSNALKTLLMLNLHSQAGFQEYFTRQTHIKLSIEHVLIKQAVIEELPSDPNDPDHINVMVSIPFYGISGLTSFLLDDQELYVEPPTGSLSSTDPPVESEDYTGIIIDARQISPLEPALLPKILSEDGEILYQASQVAKDTLQSEGMIEYIREAPTRTTWRAGQNPLVITPLFLVSVDEATPFLQLAQEQSQTRRRKGNNLMVGAAGSEGKIPANVVVSVEDAKKIKQLNEQQQLDKQGKYTILIGGEIGGVKGQYPDGFFVMNNN